MKRSFFAILTAALFLTGCYRDDLWNMHKEMESLENETIASLSEQADNIEASIANLNELNSTIYEFIEELQASGLSVTEQLAETQKLIDSFKQAAEETVDANAAAFLKRINELNDAVLAEVGSISAVASSLDPAGDAIQKKIDSLEQYLESFAGKEWVEGTFATLLVQNSLISELASLKERVNTLSEAATNLDVFLTNTIDAAYEDFMSDFDADLAERAHWLVGLYTEAINDMSGSLKAANTEAVIKAVEESEQSVMDWINNKLKDYYKVEQANAQCEAFDLILGALPDGKASFQIELTELYSAIDEARFAVTSAYGKAIEDAISKHEGVIKDKVDSEIKKLREDYITPLSDRIAPVKSDIDQLKKDVTALTGQISTAEQQREKISSSLSVLTTLDKTLKEYVESVKAELLADDAANYDALKKLIDALDALVSGNDAASLPSQISALKSYLGTIPTGYDDAAKWIETTLATINKQFETIKLTSEVDEIFTAIKTLLNDTNEPKIQKLEDDLDALLETNEAKIKGWISTKLQAYNKTAEIEGFLTGLENEVKSYFANGDKTIQDGINELTSALAAKKTSLTTDYEKAIADAITTEKGIVDGRITSDFANVDKDVKDLEDKASSLETDVAALRSELSGYMKDVEALKVRMTALETFLAAKVSKDESYESLQAVVTDLMGSIDDLSDTYADKTAFDTMYDYITGTLSVKADEVEGLVTRLDTVETSLDAIKDIVGEFDGTSSSLYAQLTAISTAIDALKLCVNGSDTQDSFQDQIDGINKALYGDGGTADSPVAGSILADLNSLKAVITANHLSSLTYVPRYIDQTEELVVRKNALANNAPVTADFRFIVRPASLASSITDYLSMKYKPIDGGASSLTEFDSVSFTVEDDIIQVSVSAPAKNILDDSGKPKVCAVLEYNCTDDDGNVLSSFTSKFIFLSVFEEKSTGDIPYVGPRILHFPAEGGSATVTVGGEDQTVAGKKAFWLIRRLSLTDYNKNAGLIDDVRLAIEAANISNVNLYKPSWISVDPLYTYDFNSQDISSIIELMLSYPFVDCYDGPTQIKISVPANNDSYPRSGELVFRSIFNDFSSFRDSAADTQDLIIYVEQDGKLD